VLAPYPVYAVLDLALLPWVATILIRVLLRAGNRRNLPLGAILLLLAGANRCSIWRCSASCRSIRSEPCTAAWH
jgi:uncharacterized protein involved in response to NO